MTKVSILVAVYNSAYYLKRCLDSLLAQTLTDIQIICIDDCSTDNSIEILYSYKQKDHRIEVIALNNNYGQAHARNEGLKLAKGKYITFVDSDDWVSEDAMEKAVEIMESDDETDCVLFDVLLYYPRTRKTEHYPMKSFDCMDGNTALEASIDWKIHGWYMIKTSIHKKYPYDETCRTYSDDNTTRIHYYVSRKIACCKGVYYYYQNPMSVTHAVSTRRFDYMRANESMKRQLIEIKASQKIMNMYENIRWMVLVDTYMFYFNNRERLTKYERKQCLSEMRKIWQNIETHRLRKKLKFKFGYLPLRNCWFLFRVQEEVYFTLKKLMPKH